jgi:hypothetical protein
MENILRVLRNTDQSVPSYVWQAWLISMIPSLLISALVAGVRASAGYGNPPLKLWESPVWLVLLGVFLVGPWIETLVMWPILAVLKRVIQNTILVALASAVVWGVFHGLTDPGWGLIVIWAFFVFSLCFLEWEKKSRRKAIVVTSLVHMCHNSIPVVSVLATRWL